MKIKRTSLICKIARTRYQDNLCRFFWRLVGHVFCVVFIAGVSAFLIYSWIVHPQAIFLLFIILFFVGFIVLPPLAIKCLRAILRKSPELPYENIVFEYLKAKKQKVCPLIEYVD